MAATESALWQTLERARGRSAVFQGYTLKRMESHNTVVGCPDVWYASPQRICGWIELKVGALTRRGLSLAEPLKSEQHQWLRDADFGTTYCWLLVGVAGAISWSDFYLFRSCYTRPGRLQDPTLAHHLTDARAVLLQMFDK